MNRWVQFLKERKICHDDAVGNMPCDNGAICDNCMTEEVRKDFENWIEKNGYSNDTEHT